MPRNSDIQFRRGTNIEWNNADPVLNSGEPGFDVTNDIFKIGDGSTSWTGLPEFAPFNTNLIAGSGISLVYDSGNSTLTINSSGTGGGLANVVEDLTPQLGGNLDLNSSSITGVGNINISGDITANTGNFDVLSFNINNESVLTKGQISWDDTEGTMDIGLTDNTTIHIGSHRYFRIRNETGGTLYKGQVVYASGVHANGIIEPALYVADGAVREVRFMGVILEDVNHQNNGYAIDFGHLEEMDLDGSATNYAVGDETWVAGDILYVHPTVAGKLTKNEPKHSISVAIVLDPGNGNGNGRMFVRPTSYGHLDDNHDVAVSGATNGQFLQYNSATDYWVPSSSGNFTTLLVNGTPVPTGVGTSNYVTKWTGTNSIGNSVIYDNGTNVGIGTSSPTQKLQVITNQLEVAAFNFAPSIGPLAPKDLQNFIIESRNDSIILKHLENPLSDGVMELKNLIRYSTDFISIDAAYSGVLGITYYPKLKVNTSTGATTFNDAYTLPTTDGSSGQALITDGAGNVNWTNIVLNQTVNGRLTLESGVPISTTNQTAKTTLYFTPYLGNQIALYNGTEWKIYTFSELSLSLSGYTANTNYDIFIYDNSGTLTLESAAWTNGTTRATSLTTQDGVYVKSGATTRRYLGTIRITATTGQCEDSFSRKFIWNLYNQINKLLNLTYYPGAAPHTYTTSTWRPWNNTTVVGDTRLELVRGLNLSLLETKVWCEMINGWSSIGVDSTSAAFFYFKANSGDTGAADSINKFVNITAGYHYLQALQYGTTGSTFYSLYVQSSFLG